MAGMDGEGAAEVGKLECTICQLPMNPPGDSHEFATFVLESSRTTSWLSRDIYAHSAACYVVAQPWQLTSITLVANFALRLG